ncbi:MAG: PAS domain-containing protein [Gemmatimonadota bacterium]
MSPGPATRGRTPDWLALTLLGVAFLVAHQIGMRSITPLSPLSPVWPLSGVALGAFLLLRRQLWPVALAVVIVADIASNAMSGARILVGTAYLIPSLVELAIALWLMRRIAGSHITFHRVRDTFALVVAASVGAAVSGLVAGAIAVSTSNVGLAASVATWGSSDLLGMLLLTPLIVAWARSDWKLAAIRWPRVVEGVLFMTCWVWSAAQMFTGDLTIGWLRPHPYMLASFMVWAAFRLGIRGATAAMSSVAVVAIYVVLTRPASFSLGGTNITEQLFLLQVYLAVMGLTGLLLASALAERSEAADAARENGDRLRALADNLPNRVIFQLVQDASGARRFLYVSASVEQVFGVAPGEVLERSDALYALVDPSDRARLLQAEAASAQNLSELGVELRVRAPDGGERWVMISSIPRRPDAQRIVWDGIAVDITERRRDDARRLRANRALRATSSCTQALVRARTEDELLREVCRVIVADTGFRLAWVGFVNDATPRQVQPMAHAGHDDGYLDHVTIRIDEAPWNAGPVATAVHTETVVVCRDLDADPTMAPWRAEVIARGYRSLLALPLQDGTRAFGALCVYSADVDAFDDDEIALLTDLSGDLAYGILALRAHAEHARAEAALGRSEERFRQMAENIREVFWMLDARSNKLLYISPGVERLYGVSAAALVESPLLGLDRIHPDDRPRVLRASAAASSGGVYDEEYRVVHVDGTVHWVHARAFPVRDASGDIYRVVGLSDDITARKRIEEQLRQVQKLEAIGQLAGGVAHDFNNILAAILLQVGMARGLSGMPDEAAELLQEMDAAAQRAANLTRQLLLFSRKQAMQLRPVDLNDLVAALMRMLRRVVPEHVQVRLSLHPRTLTVHADPGMLEQVVMNLTVNARDAMPDGGILSIETYARDLSDADARAFPGAAAGRFGGVRVRDSGCGIAADHITQIFDPFFTTKEPGKGTGLGLATVFGIVQQHRGAIFVHSVAGEGTTMDVLLPASDVPEVELPLPEPALPAPRAERRTILVVEDDRAVRAMTRRILERHGYHVHTAATGREALDTWSRYSPPVDLVLTDLVMPDGVGGIELAATLLMREPHLRVVYSSGYDPDHATRNVRLEPGVNFLQKPATARQIVSTVAQMLETR